MMDQILQITWEYKIVPKCEDPILEKERLMNALGREGYELCAVDADNFYFKRLAIKQE